MTSCRYLVRSGTVWAVPEQAPKARPHNLDDLPRHHGQGRCEFSRPEPWPIGTPLIFNLSQRLHIRSHGTLAAVFPVKDQSIILPIDNYLREQRPQNGVKFVAILYRRLRHGTHAIQFRRQSEIEPTRRIDPHSPSFFEQMMNFFINLLNCCEHRA